jgi:hypothetical protein
MNGKLIIRKDLEAGRYDIFEGILPVSSCTECGK